MGFSDELTETICQAKKLFSWMANQDYKQVFPYIAAGSALLGGLYFMRQRLDRPSRPFEDVESVGNEYDKWTSDGILEHFWGEHIHLGFYGPQNRSWFDASRSFLTNFIQATRSGIMTDEFKRAKLVFTAELLRWSEMSTANAPLKVLDVGCGIGGTSRYMAKQFPTWKVTGLSISPCQIERAKQLVASQKVDNCEFICGDAMSMPFPDCSFDVVWSCESAEHMPDKEGFLKECFRVLKPGGKFVMATWCQRDDTLLPFSDSEQRKLDFLYKEWCHPKFASIEEYERICMGMGMKNISKTDWTEQTLPSWRHSVFVGMWAPWAVIIRPHCWWSTIREIVTLERMHCAFRDKLMVYGILRGEKM